MTMEEENIRLYVGGLPPEVSAGDLHERFAPLGHVKGITLPSAKTGPGHRGFAYVDFVPATDASLRKLFSAYNGCKWRGGLLRIAKAKEHFSDRLQREWAVEAASLTKDLSSNKVEAVPQAALASAGHKQFQGGKKGEEEVSGLKIFFPKFRKLRTVPLTGMGKHKRSFQRVESSPLQLLLSSTCEESLRLGSRDDSTREDGISTFKEDTCLENDDIAQATKIERERQLELLNRLFPSDSTSISLENQEVVELTTSKGKDEDAVGSIKTISSEQSLLPRVRETGKQEQPTHSLGKSEFESFVDRGDSDPFDSKSDPGNEKIGSEDDSVSTAVARERVKQLELMQKLFCADAPCKSRDSEPETAGPTKVTRAKKKRKLNASKFGADLVETEQEQMVSKITPALKRNTLSEGASMAILNATDGSIPDVVVEDQDMLALQGIANVPTDISQDDSEMVLNIGYNPFSFATAEEQEKHDLESLSVKANKSLDMASKITPQLKDDSLSLANVKQGERRMSKSSQDIILVDGSEDSDMYLNLGNDAVPLSKAEDQEKALVRSFSRVKNKWPRGPSDSDTTDEVQDSKVGEHSSEEGDYSDYSNGTRQSNEAEHSRKEKYANKGQSQCSSDAEEAGDRRAEGQSSQEQNDSLQNDYRSDLPLPVERTTKMSADASLKSRKGGSILEKQLEESPNWAALSHMCEFRDEGTMAAEGSESERNPVPAASSNKGDDILPVEVSDFPVDETKGPVQQQTGANSEGRTPDSAGQKLTRAAWKSLVGETGRVIFSLRQVTGSSLAQTPPSTEEAHTFKDTKTPTEPSVIPQRSNQNKSEFKLVNGTAESKSVGVRITAKPKMNAAEHTSTPVSCSVPSGDVCPFMKSENAEEEWLATKSELRSDYRARQKHAARNVKKLWGKR